MNKPFLILAIITALTSAVDTHAQVRVVRSAGQKIPMDWSSYSTDGNEASKTFFQTLQNDLSRAGWFMRASPAAAELALTGSASGGSGLRAEIQLYSKTEQRRYLGKVYKADAQGARKLAHQVADEIVEAVTGRKGMASAKIALVGNRTKTKEIYLCDADGQGLIQLTQDKTVSIAPGWGPDGKSLVYTSYLKSFPDVFWVNLSSGERKRIASYGGLNTGASISPDGRSVALILSKDGNPELYVRALMGGTLTRLTSTTRAAEASPSWSPDGQRIVYVSDQSGTPQLYLVSSQGGAPRRLTSRGSQNVAPDWGANGWIAYSSLIGGSFQVCVVNPDNGEVRQLTTDGADYEDPSWAPDQRHLVCARSVRYKSKLYLLDTMGDEPQSLTNYEGDWTAPAFSP